jgi:hypothetical protein
MQMRVGIKYVIIACCVAALATAAGAQGKFKTTIDGTPPFTLGTALDMVLRGNPGFHQTSTPCPMEVETVNAVTTVNYETRLTAPLAGYPYIAHVVLCFYQGKLAVIHLEWPSSGFRDSVLEWRLRAQELARQLTSTYAPDLLKRNFVDDDFGGRVEMRDGQGDVLTMIANANAHGLNIVLDYVGAAYRQALVGPGSLEGSY